MDYKLENSRLDEQLSKLRACKAELEDMFNDIDDVIQSSTETECCSCNEYDDEGSYNNELSSSEILQISYKKPMNESKKYKKPKYETDSSSDCSCAKKRLEKTPRKNSIFKYKFKIPLSDYSLLNSNRDLNMNDLIMSVENIPKSNSSDFFKKNQVKEEVYFSKRPKTPNKSLNESWKIKPNVESKIKHLWSSNENLNQRESRQSRNKLVNHAYKRPEGLSKIKPIWASSENFSHSPRRPSRPTSAMSSHKYKKPTGTSKVKNIWASGEHINQRSLSPRNRRTISSIGYVKPEGQSKVKGIWESNEALEAIRPIRGGKSLEQKNPWKHTGTSKKDLGLYSVYDAKINQPMEKSIKAKQEAPNENQIDKKDVGNGWKPAYKAKKEDIFKAPEVKIDKKPKEEVKNIKEKTKDDKDVGEGWKPSYKSKKEDILKTPEPKKDTKPKEENKTIPKDDKKIWKPNGTVKEDKKITSKPPIAEKKIKETVENTKPVQKIRLKNPLAKNNKKLKGSIDQVTSTPNESKDFSNFKEEKKYKNKLNASIIEKYQIDKNDDQLKDEIKDLRLEDMESNRPGDKPGDKLFSEKKELDEKIRDERQEDEEEFKFDDPNENKISLEKSEKEVKLEDEEYYDKDEVEEDKDNSNLLKSFKLNLIKNEPKNQIKKPEAETDKQEPTNKLKKPVDSRKEPISPEEENKEEEGNFDFFKNFKLNLPKDDLKNDDLKSNGKNESKKESKNEKKKPEMAQEEKKPEKNEEEEMNFDFFKNFKLNLLKDDDKKSDSNAKNEENDVSNNFNNDNEEDADEADQAPVWNRTNSDDE